MQRPILVKSEHPAEPMMMMFHQPLEQTRSLPQVENIFVSSSPRPRFTLNRD